MSNNVLDTYYKSKPQSWVLVVSGDGIGTMIGLLATAFQLLLEFILLIKLG
ncbi:ClC family H(+)/Cl(-) exchange transporter, partial [Francisella tularensis subsp. holarctica]|nr:ClC family H(+)/Cl(-) exchange transporter [Francisella tularensis subsp. holarctica]